MRAHWLIPVVATVLCGCSLLLDPYGGIPCESTDTCFDGYRCTLGYCEPAGTEVCGDLVAEGAEQCDDGNDLDGDGCDSECRFPPCPDGGVIGDADNCGVCGRSCLGANCQQGKCEPELLAGGRGWIEAIAVDSSHLYFVDNGEVPTSGDEYLRRVPIAGGSIEIVLERDKLETIALTDSDVVYLIADGSNGEVGLVDKEGGTPTILASTLAYPTWCALNGTDIFFDEAGADLIRKVSTSGGSVATITNYSLDASLTGDGLALVGGNVYWHSSFIVFRAPQGGGSYDAFDTGEYLSFVATDGTDLYLLRDRVVDGMGILRCELDLTSCSPVAGTDISTSSEMTVDDVHIYWTDQDGLFRIPKAGGTKLQIADLNAEWSVEVDDTHLYYVTRDWDAPEGAQRSIWRVAK